MNSAACIKKYFPLLILGVAAFAVFFVWWSVSFASAQSDPPEGPSESQVYDRGKAIQIASESGGPGGCDSVAACDAYCNTPANQAECMNWARANGVISDENYQKYYNIAVSGGPGGCKTPDSCRDYCENPDNFEQCLNFAQDQGLISPEQARQARKTGPGGCRTQKDCQAFCEQPQNQDACIDHAVSEGFMTREEAKRIKEFRSRADEFRKKAEEFRQRADEFGKPPEVKEIDPGFDEVKAGQIIETQGGPGGCKTFEACEKFCDNPENELACFDFAEKHSLFTNSEHAAKIKRIMQEGGPGGCRGEEACRRFCEQEANFQICIDFAQKEGLLPPHEIERAKKGLEALKEGGPAGCRMREECDRVCRDPANQDACFEWAKRHGLISDEELRFIEEAKQLRQEFDRRREHFENEFRPPEEFQPPGEFLGPGGCKGADECRKYCAEPAHTEECQKFFRTPSGIQPPGFGGTPPPYSQPPHPEYSPAPNYNKDPASTCAEKGGTWTGSYCKFSSESSPTPYPTHSPYQQPGPAPSPYYKPEPLPYYSPQPSTEDPARKCAESGGTWVENTCKFSLIKFFFADIARLINLIR